MLVWGADWLQVVPPCLYSNLIICLDKVDLGEYAYLKRDGGVEKNKKKKKKKNKEKTSDLSPICVTFAPRDLIYLHYTKTRRAFRRMG